MWPKENVICPVRKVILLAIGINIQSVSFSYSSDKNILKNVSLEVQPGEAVALVGDSGIGKTTLLELIAGFIPNESGGISFFKKDGKKRSTFDTTHLAKKNLGFVFQDFYLIEHLNAVQNIILPGVLTEKLSMDTLEARALSIMNGLGIGSLFDKYPVTMSGGEKQRVCIARAFFNSPQLILADEPTGSLDSKNTQIVIDLLLNTAKKKRTTLIVATHSRYVSERMDRTINLQSDGSLKSNIYDKEDGF